MTTAIAVLSITVLTLAGTNAMALAMLGIERRRNSNLTVQRIVDRTTTRANRPALKLATPRPGSTS